MSDESSKDCCDRQVLRARLDSVAQAQKRSRAAFLASAIACVALIVPAWNAYGSWSRGFLSGRSFASPEVTREAQKSLVDEWVRSLKVSVPVLGIQAGIGDAAFLGSVSLYVICVWIYLSVRRENQMIGNLLRETRLCDVGTRKMVLEAIVSESMFPLLSSSDAPIDDLDQPKREVRLGFVRWSHKSLILLPCMTILLLLVTDFVSIFFLSSLFRESSLPLSMTLGLSDWVKRGLMEWISLALWIPTVLLCFRNVKYIDGTESILYQFEKGLSTNERPPSI